MSIDTYFCFCCLSTNDLTHIYDNDADVNYGKELFQLFNLNISRSDYEDDGYICGDCTRSLKNATQFKDQVFHVLNVLQGNGLIEITNEDQQVIVKKVVNENIEDEQKFDYSDVKRILGPEPSEKQMLIEKTNLLPQLVPKIERDKATDEREVKHVTRYEVTEDLKCEVCAEELPNAYVYHSHMNQHFPNHICEACGKGFLTVKRLKRHMQSHRTGMFPCDICDAEFTNYNSVNSHRRRKHGSVSIYACPHCPVRFDTLTRRALHLAREHARPPPCYRCALCGKRFLLAGDRISYSNLLCKGRSKDEENPEEDVTHGLEISVSGST